MRRRNVAFQHEAKSIFLLALLSFSLTPLQFKIFSFFSFLIRVSDNGIFHFEKRKIHVQRTRDTTRHESRK